MFNITFVWETVYLSLIIDMFLFYKPNIIKKIKFNRTIRFEVVLLQCHEIPSTVQYFQKKKEKL